MTDEHLQRHRRLASAGELTPEAARAAVRAQRCVHCGNERRTSSLIPTFLACCYSCWQRHCLKEGWQELWPIGDRCSACAEACY